MTTTLPGEHAPGRPPEIQALFKALIRVEAMSEQLVVVYADVIKQHQTGSRPRAVDWPQHAEERRRRDAQLLARDRADRGDQAANFVHRPWAALLQEFQEATRLWHDSIQPAIEAVRPASVLRGCDPPLQPEFFHQIRKDLRKLQEQVVVGLDGLALVRFGCPPLPDEFHSLLRTIGDHRRGLIDVIQVSTPPEPAPPSAPSRNAEEEGALTLLGDREVWGMDEVAPLIDGGILRCLDADGLILVRAVAMIRPQDGRTPSATIPQAYQWFSPIREPELGGDWDLVLSRLERGEHVHPHEVKLSDRGRAELDRLQRRRAAAKGGTAAGPAAPAAPLPDGVADQLRRLQDRFEACYHGGKRLTLLVSRQWQFLSRKQWPPSWQRYHENAGATGVGVYRCHFDDADTNSRREFEALAEQGIRLVTAIPEAASLGRLGYWIGAIHGFPATRWTFALAEAAADGACHPILATRQVVAQHPVKGWRQEMPWDPAARERDLARHPDWRAAADATELHPDAYFITPVGDAFLASVEAIARILRAIADRLPAEQPLPLAKKSPPMPPAQPHVSEAELTRVRAIAAAFQGRGEPVYPGRVLVMRAQSFCLQPIDDDALDPTNERIMGIALWGAEQGLGKGVVSLDATGDESSVPMLIVDLDRPATGVSVVDTWIARADALRRLIQDAPAVPAGIRLRPVQLMAAVEEVTKQTRHSAAKLLAKAPRDRRDALIALARVADMSKPDAESLTAAVRELLASASGWAADAPADPPRPDPGPPSGARGRSGDRPGTSPAKTKRLKPCVEKAGKSLAEACQKRDDLIPEAGRKPSKKLWEWVRDHHYPKGRCPSYDSWCRYVREFYADGEATRKKVGERVEVRGSTISAKDRAAQ